MSQHQQTGQLSSHGSMVDGRTQNLDHPKIFARKFSRKNVGHISLHSETIATLDQPKPDSLQPRMHGFGLNCLVRGTTHEPPRFLRLATPSMLVCRLREGVCFHSRTYLTSRMRRRTSAIHPTAALYHCGFVGMAHPSRHCSGSACGSSSRSPAPWAPPAHMLPVRALSPERTARTKGCSCCNGKPVSVGPNQFACQEHFPSL